MSNCHAISFSLWQFYALFNVNKYTPNYCYNCYFIVIYLNNTFCWSSDNGLYVFGSFYLHVSHMEIREDVFIFNFHKIFYLLISRYYLCSIFLKKNGSPIVFLITHFLPYLFVGNGNRKVKCSLLSSYLDRLCILNIDRDSESRAFA